MYLNTTNLTQHSESEIRALFPNTSFPVPFLAPEGYVFVFPTPQPEFNPVTQRAQETTPVLTVKGHYEQQWKVLPRFTEYTNENNVVHTVAEQEAAAIEADRKSKVPTVVTIRQARLALLQSGLLDDIDAAIAASTDRALKIEWEFATEFRRDWPALISMQPALGLTDPQVDDLFVLAATL